MNKEYEIFNYNKKNYANGIEILNAFNSTFDVKIQLVDDFFNIRVFEKGNNNNNESIIDLLSKTICNKFYFGKTIIVYIDNETFQIENTNSKIRKA